MNGEEWWPNEPKLVDPAVVLAVTVAERGNDAAAKMDEDFTS